MIHRDIKPSNILLKNRSGNSVGEVYLVDFGAVQTLATQQGKTVTVVGTYGYMPPEQFGGRAVPASDLYSLGATLIALITKQHPADLPQKDLQLEFEQFTQLSPAFTNWLKWMTHPSLERRPASVQIAKEVLETPQKINKYSQTLRQDKIVNSDTLFTMATFYSIWTGAIAVGVCAAIYSTFFWGIEGTIMGGILGIILGSQLGLENGIIVGIVTISSFSPLTNPKSHRQVLTAISMGISTLTTIVFFQMMYFSPVLDSNYIFVVLAPSLIAGLSMGASTKSLARWYQKESGL